MKNKKYFKVLVGLSSACFLTNIVATSFNKNITKNEIKNINKIIYLMQILKKLMLN